MSASGEYPFEYLLCAFTLFVVVLGSAGYVHRKFVKTHRPTPLVKYRIINQTIAESSSRSSSSVKTCAIIGGTGFIGNHLVNQLLSTGSNSYRVYVLGRHIPTESGRHPSVAGYIQVDMRDYDGLVRAFSNVDTVFHFGAVIPNAFVSSRDAVWEGNRSGAVAVVKACKTVGVKNLIYLHGFLQAENRLQHSKQVFSASKAEASKLIFGAHEDEGLKTCVANASVIFGQGDKFTENFITGRVTTVLNFQHKMYFMYVKTLAPLLVQLDEKLTAGDDRIAGKAVDLPGERMTFVEFFGLPEWKQKPTIVSVNLAKIMAYLNQWCAQLINYAPFGIALCPQIINDLNTPIGHDVSPDVMLSVFGLKQVPSVREDIKAVVNELKM